jgi:putative transcriptional regulator
MTDDPFRALVESHALGALEGQEASAFEKHLASGCAECRAASAAAGSALGRLAKGLAAPGLRAPLREQLIDLSQAPQLPIDLAALEWEERAPGIRLHTVKEDPARGMRACLAWVKPGAINESHRHLGDECILVLQGGLKDERGEYGPGQLCRSRKGSIHHEEALPGEDCLCYVVYYGALEFL